MKIFLFLFIAATLIARTSFGQDNDIIYLTDSLLSKLQNRIPISRDELVNQFRMGSSYIENAEDFVLFDTTVFVNDSIFFSIITILDTVQSCTGKYFFVINNLQKNLVYKNQLFLQCKQVDASGNYEISEYSVPNKNLIVLTTQYFRKKARTRYDEKKDFFEKEIIKGYISIEKDGNITISTVPPN